jgi:hypothetical protein
MVSDRPEAGAYQVTRGGASPDGGKDDGADGGTVAETRLPVRFLGS